MTYIIMADGKERRWKNHQGIHKWEIRIGQQTLLERTCSILRRMDPTARIYITSHNPALQIEGAIRHEPENNLLEVDRFTRELIKPDVCFLYGDSYYSEESLACIMQQQTGSVLVFGNSRKIFAIKIADADLFLHHMDRVRDLFLREQIRECIGWEVYHAIQGMPLESREIGKGFICLDAQTRDFNTPEDWDAYQAEHKIER